MEELNAQLEAADRPTDARNGEYFTPRDYQLELLDCAVDHNCIVSLGTGFGKTYIAILLIKEFSYKLLKDGLKAFFVVDKIALAQQQEKQVEGHTNLSVGLLHGMLNPETWENSRLFHEFYSKNQVIVCTHEILNGLLNSAFVKMADIALLIVDECHHVVGANHPYRVLMNRYRETEGQRPRVLGLTATVVNSNTKFEKIEDMIRNMETLMCAKLETASQVANLAKYGPKPQLAFFQCKEDSRIHQTVYIHLSEAEEQVKYFRFVNVQLDGEELVNSIKDGVRKAISALEVLGAWCCARVCTMLVEQFRKAEKTHADSPNRERLVAFGLTTFQQAVAYLEPLSRWPKNNEDFAKYVTDQVMTVVKILKFRAPTKERPLSAIVFVKERHHAFLLNLFLNRVATTSPAEFGFIKADYVIGRQGFSLHNTEEVIVANRRQEQTISRFRTGALNILVSTSVLEEGIDVKSCNLVIRVAPPADFRSYIQSRGRARAQNAVYCLLATGEEIGKLRERMGQWKKIEELLISRFSTSNEDGGALEQQPLIPDLFPPYVVEKTGARVTMTTAIPLVNRYCSKLPSDVFTRLVPEVKIESAMGGGPQAMYTAKLYLPINAPIKRAIVLDTPVPSKALAKIGVALKACEMLHSKHELTDHLLPAGKDSMFTNSLLSEVVEDEEYMTSVVGRNIKKRRLYDRKVSKTLHNSLAKPGEPCNVYIIDIHLVEPLSDEENLKKRKIIDPHTHAAAFGFICRCDLPAITQFPAFLRQGKTQITFVRAASPMIVDAETMALVYEFHAHIFEDILRVAKNAVAFAPEDCLIPLLIVPVIKKHDAAGRLVDCELDRARLTPDIRRTVPDPTPDERRAYTFDAARFHEAVVTPWYRVSDHSTYYYVAEILEDTHPHSDFPDKKYTSFNEYFAAKYSIEIFNQQQPLLDVDRASERMNLILPRAAPLRAKSRCFDPTQKQILIPELVHVHPLTATYWTMIIALPTILYRLNQFLLVDELRCLIVEEAFGAKTTVPADHRWPPLDYEAHHSTPAATAAHQSASNTSASSVGEPKIKHIAQMRKKEEPKPVRESLPTADEDGMESFMDAAPEWSENGRQQNFSISVWDPNDAAQFQQLRTDPFGLSATTDGQAEKLGEQAALGRTGDDLEYSDGEEVEEYEILTDFNKGLKENIGNLAEDPFAPRKRPVDDGFGWESGGMLSQSEATMRTENGLISLSGAAGIDVGGLMADVQKHLTTMTAEPAPSPAARNGSAAAKKTAGSGMSPRPNAVDVPSRREAGASRLMEEFVDERLIEQGAKNVGERPATFEQDIRKGTVLPDESSKSVDTTEDLSWLVDGQFEVTAPAHAMAFAFNAADVPADAEAFGVPPALLLQALTTASASDGMNLERLETIGDSFLKLAVTSCLYNQHSTEHEGRLSFARSKEVSNTHLYKLGLHKNLPSIMEASKFDPNVSWLPPGYTSTAVFHAMDWADPDEEIEKIRRAAEGDGDKQPKTAWEAADQEEQPLKIENGVETITLAKANKNPDVPSPYNTMTQQCINDKAIADAVEALIGAHLTSLGPQSTLKFMDWLGLKVQLNPTKPESPLLQFEDSDEDARSSLDCTHSSLVFQPEKSKRTLREFYVKHAFEKVEERIGYKFGNKAFLVQAFTHASYFKGRVTGCYQRLEFLGDAVLDYLITRFLFEHPGRFAPGILTDLRSALVNNTIFASLAVKHGLHKFFLALSSNLAYKIEKFVQICETQHHANQTPNFNAELFMVTEEEVEDGHEEDVEVPKALGDIFESLAGAVFLDCGMDLDVVWRVYFNLMREQIENCCKNPPLSPVRELFELKGSNAHFTKLERVMETNKIRVTVQIDDNLRFEGMGRSFRIAKATAAKRALKYLHSLDAQRKQEGRTSAR
ncbi:hypothetical protein M3Y99_01177100 [Aphelenchoides fujianensis]|nr:hypothetical protein M3Y99_01177100 [Aphelenchoides fujianensis]